MLGTQPIDFKRFTIIVVMCMNLKFPTNFARLPDELSVSYMVPNQSMSSVFYRIPLSVSFVPGSVLFPKFCPSFFTDELFLSALAVILLDAFKILLTVLCDILLVTLLALIDVSITHLRMLIELGEWFNLSALKAPLFRRCLRHQKGELSDSSSMSSTGALEGFAGRGWLAASRGASFVTGFEPNSDPLPPPPVD
jgi:hypothetical protein